MEISIMETQHLFDDKSGLYASYRPHYPRVLFDFINETCKGKEKAWDCATGNGQAAQGLSRIFKEVEATDISKNQISEQMKLNNVRYSVQSAEETSFESSSFDCVNVAQALHWFDRSRFWKEVGRVLKPQGLFIAYTYSGSTINREIDETVEQFISQPIRPYWPENNRHCWNGYKDIEFPFEKIPVPSIVMEKSWTCSEYLNYLGTWSATRRCIDDIGDGFINEASIKIQDIWGGKDQVRTVRTRLSITAGFNWS